MKNGFRYEELASIRAPLDHSRNNLDISTLSRKKIEKGIAPFLHHVRFFRKREFNNVWRTCARCIWSVQREGGSVLLTCFATGPESRHQAQAAHPFEELLFITFRL